MAEKCFSDYKNAAAAANKAKAGGIAATKQMTTVTVDKNGKKVKVEKGPVEKVEIKPATTSEVFNTSNLQKKQETKPIPSEHKVNNTDQTKDWMSVADMLEGK